MNYKSILIYISLYQLYKLNRFVKRFIYKQLETLLGQTLDLLVMLSEIRKI
jgi:hypothetical protein